MSEPKQVIVVRKDLSMRKGKIISQSSHASMKVLLDRLEWYDLGIEHGRDFAGNFSCETNFDTHNPQEKAFYEWIKNKFAKICVYVNSEEELDELHEKAKQAGVVSAMIVDAGRTEFHGVPTKTCLAIGPDYPENIDPITGHLKLL